MINDSEIAVKALCSINFIDSALLGACLDIFKVRLLVSAVPTLESRSYGFEGESEDICCDFRMISNVHFDLRKSIYSPPYLEEGSLSWIDLADFKFEKLIVTDKGVTADTNRVGVYGSEKKLYGVDFALSIGSIRFTFGDLTITRLINSHLDGYGDNLLSP